MSAFKQALGNAKLLFVCLTGALILSFALNIMLSVMLYNVPKNLPVFVSRGIPATGALIKPGQISKYQVYNFVNSTMLNILSWEKNGAKAFPAKINANDAYLSTVFQNELKDQVTQMQNKGFLYGHTQITFGVGGNSFNQSNVKKVDGLWYVRLILRTKNYVRGLGEGADTKSHLASDVVNSYVFKVSKFPVIPGFNVTGLRIDSYATAPKIIKVYR